MRYFENEQGDYDEDEVVENLWRPAGERLEGFGTFIGIGLCPVSEFFIESPGLFGAGDATDEGIGKGLVFVGKDVGQAVAVGESLRTPLTGGEQQAGVSRFSGRAQAGVHFLAGGEVNGKDFTEAPERKVAVHGAEQWNAAHQAVGGGTGGSASPECGESEAEDNQQQVDSDKNKQPGAGGGPGIAGLVVGVEPAHQCRTADAKRRPQMKQEDRIGQAAEDASAGLGNAGEMVAEMVKGPLQQATALTGVEDGFFQVRDRCRAIVERCRDARAVFDPAQNALTEGAMRRWQSPALAFKHGFAGLADAEAGSSVVGKLAVELSAGRKGEFHGGWWRKARCAWRVRS